MWFKLTYSLGDMFVQTTIESSPTLEVKIGEGQEVHLRSSEKEKGGSRLFCEALIERKLSAELDQMFASLANGVLPLDVPPVVELPYELSFDAIIDTKGNIPDRWGIPLKILPKKFQTLSREIHSQLSELATSFIKTLRWVQRASGRQRPFAHVDFKWSPNKSDWKSMPFNHSVRVIETRGISSRKQAIEQVLAIWRSGEREPLSHELIREALGIAHSNPRSALLIGVSALETGLKEYIYFRVPNSNFILASMPSPPAIAMMQEVIPGLHRVENLELHGLPLGKEEAAYLRKWITQRNQIAHGLKGSLDVDDLDNFLKFVRAQLYTLDVFRGRDWAKTHLEPEEQDMVIVE